MKNSFKQFLTQVLSQLKYFPNGAKKKVLNLLAQKDVEIAENRTGINQIYQCLAIIFTRFPKMRVPENKEKLQQFSEKLEQQAPDKHLDITAKH